MYLCLQYDSRSIPTLNCYKEVSARCRTKKHDAQKKYNSILTTHLIRIECHSLQTLLLAKPLNLYQKDTSASSREPSLKASHNDRSQWSQRSFRRQCDPQPPDFKHFTADIFIRNVVKITQWNLTLVLCLFRSLI